MGLHARFKGVHLRHSVVKNGDNEVKKVVFLGRFRAREFFFKLVFGFMDARMA